jgi:hypothetical protein
MRFPLLFSTVGLKAGPTSFCDLLKNGETFVHFVQVE